MKENKLINLKYDFMFTTIFNREENVSKLERFISTYFGYTYEQVHGNLKLIKRNLDKKSRNEAKKEVDLLLTLDNMKKNMNIEIDSNKYDNIIKRNTIYLCKIAGEYNYKSGDNNYNEIFSSRQIAFNTNSKVKNKKLFIDEKRLVSLVTNKIFTDVIEIDEINTNLVDSIDYNLLDEKEKMVYNFIKLLNATNEEEFERISEELMSKKESKELTKQVSALSNKFKYIEMASTYKSDEDRFQDTLKCATEEAVSEIIEQIEKDITKKVTDDVTKKVTDDVTRKVTDDVTKKVKLDTAKKMLEKNMSIKDIIEITDLSKKEIENL